MPLICSAKARQEGQVARWASNDRLETGSRGPSSRAEINASAASWERRAGAGVAFGAAFEAFDPARARADEDLESRRQMGEVLPTPDPEHPVWNVDLQRNQVRIPRPR